MSGYVAWRNLVLALVGGQGIATSKGVCGKKLRRQRELGWGSELGLLRQREG